MYGTLHPHRICYPYSLAIPATLMNPQLPLPARITRGLILSLTNTCYFVYNDTVIHDAKGGQAKEARGCINTYPVPVKLRCCANEESSFMSDDLLEENKVLIDRAISLIPRDKMIVIFPKIGLGWNKLDEKAPLTYKYLMSELNKLTQ